jgi:hypothetical protein
MAAIRLLAAPFDPPPLPEVSAEYMSLVPASRLALTHRASAGNDIASPDDNFVWSAYAGSDGSFTFYAVPRKSSAEDWASNQWDSVSAALMSSSAWSARNAAFQYGMQASMPTPTSGQLINVYA